MRCFEGMDDLTAPSSLVTQGASQDSIQPHRRADPPPLDRSSDNHVERVSVSYCSFPISLSAHFSDALWWTLVGEHDISNASGVLMDKSIAGHLAEVTDVGEAEMAKAESRHNFTSPPSYDSIAISHRKGSSHHVNTYVVAIPPTHPV